MGGFATGNRREDTWGRFFSAVKPLARFLSSIERVINLGYISTPSLDPLATDLNIYEADEHGDGL